MSIDRRYSVAENLAYKAPARCATTANITLAGLQTIDAIATVEHDRVLVWQQTDATENGIYEASTGNWHRSKDFDGALDAMKGSQLYVARGGTAYGDNIFAVTSTGSGAFGDITFGSDDVDFDIVGGATALTLDIRKVATFSALRQLAAGVVDLVFVLGGASLSDGAEGTFYWSPSSTAADDNAITIQPNSNPASGRWIRQGSASREISAGWFAAGLTDWGAAIQAAADYLGAVGGVIWVFGDRTCATGFSLQGYLNITIRGAGGSTGGTTPASRLTYTGTAARFADLRGATGSWLEDLYIRYTSASFSGALVDFTWSDTGAESQKGGVRRCLLDGGAARSATLVNLYRATLTTLEDVHLAGGGPAIAGAALTGGASNYSNDHQITRCLFTTHRGYAILGGGSNWEFNTCTFENNTENKCQIISTNADAPVIGFTFLACNSVDNLALSATAAMVLFGGGILIAGGNWGGYPGQDFVQLYAVDGFVCTGAQLDTWNIAFTFVTATCNDVVIHGNRFTGVTSRYGSGGNLGQDYLLQGTGGGSGLATGQGLIVAGTAVVGARGAAVADATGAGDVVAQLNTLMSRLRTHGLIAP